jgi:hypothetical protein
MSAQIAMPGLAPPLEARMQLRESHFLRLLGRCKAGVVKLVCGIDE